MNIKRKKCLFIIPILIILLIIGFNYRHTLSVFLGNEDFTSIFTVGKVKIKLDQPSYIPKTSKLIADTKVPMDPTITNIGDNDLISYIALDIPLDFHNEQDEYGNIVGDPLIEELFCYKNHLDTANDYINSVNSNWVLIKDFYNNTNSYHRYIYAYDQILRPEQKGNPLFDDIILKEGFHVGPKNRKKSLYINACAIQSNLFNNIPGYDPTNLTPEVLETIWNTYINQKSIPIKEEDLTKSTSTIDLNKLRNVGGSDTTSIIKVPMSDVPGETIEEKITLIAPEDSKKDSAIDPNISQDKLPDDPNKDITENNKNPEGPKLPETQKPEANNKPELNPESDPNSNEADKPLEDQSTPVLPEIKPEPDGKEPVPEIKEPDSLENIPNIPDNTNKEPVIKDENNSNVENNTSVNTNTDKSNNNNEQNSAPVIKNGPMENFTNKTTDNNTAKDKPVEPQKSTTPKAEPLANKIPIEIKLLTSNKPITPPLVDTTPIIDKNKEVPKNNENSPSDKEAIPPIKEEIIPEDNKDKLVVDTDTNNTPNENQNNVKPEDIIPDSVKPENTIPENTIPENNKETTIPIKPESNIENNSDADNLLPSEENIGQFSTISVFKPAANVKVVSNPTSPYPIYAWKDGTTIYWASEAEEVCVDNNAKNAFKGLSSLSDISSFADFNTKDVTDMSGMFEGTSITDLSPLAKWNTKNVTTMENMFYQASLLEDVSPIKDWNISKVSKLDRFVRDTKVTDFSSLSSHQIISNEITYDAWTPKEGVTFKYIVPKIVVQNNNLPTWSIEGVWKNPGTYLRFFDTRFDMVKIKKFVTPEITAFKHYEEDVYPEVVEKAGEAVEEAGSEVPIMMWKDGTTVFWKSISGKVSLPKDASGFFYKTNEPFTKLTDISGLADIDTMRTTNIHEMFKDCKALTDISPITDWKFNRLETTRSLFQGCTALTDLNPISGWDMSKVTSLFAMFFGCSNLSDLAPISEWDITSSRSLDSAFAQCTNLVNLDALKDWDTTNNTLLCYTFSGCSGLTDVSGIQNWNTSKVTNFNSMFDFCNGLTTTKILSSKQAIDAAGNPYEAWNVGMGTTFKDTMAHCKNLNKTNLPAWSTPGYWELGSYILGYPEHSTFITSKVAKYTQNQPQLTAFKRSVEELVPVEAEDVSDDISNAPIYMWKKGNEVFWKCISKDIKFQKDISGLFKNNTSIIDISGLEYINVNDVEKTNELFHACEKLKDLTPLKNWKFTKLKDMSSTFELCKSLNDLTPLSEWNISTVTTLYDLFAGNNSLTSLNGLQKWNVSNVTSMRFTFTGCNSLADISALTNWNTPKLNNISNMFTHDIKITDLSALTNWNTNQLNNMNETFRGCNGLSDLSPLKNWNTVKLTSMYRTFADNNSLLDATAISSKITSNGFEAWNVNNLDLTIQTDQNGLNYNGLTKIFENCSNINTNKYPVWSREGYWNTKTGSYLLGIPQDSSIDGTKMRAITANKKDIVAFKKYTGTLVPENAIEVSTSTSTVPIYMWSKGSEIYWTSKAKDVYLPPDSERLFENDEMLSDISGLANMNTSKVIQMPRMFINCKRLTNLNQLYKWNVSNVQNLDSTFNGCTSLNDISGIINWDISNVKYLCYMFQNCNNISDISSLKKWNTSEAVNLSAMFAYCTKLTDASIISSSTVTGPESITYEAWNVNKVGDFKSIFTGCDKIPMEKLPKWSRIGFWRNGTYILGQPEQSTFDYLKMYPFTKENPNITAFKEAPASVSIPDTAINVASLDSDAPILIWNEGTEVFWKAKTAKVYFPSSINNLFKDDTNLSDISGLERIDTSKVTNMWSAFLNCSSLTNLNSLKNWNTSQTQTFDSLFNGCSNLNDISAISNWNTQNVIYTCYMFQGCSKISNISALSNWDTKNLVNMSAMFAYATSITDASPMNGKVINSIEYWNVNNVTNFQSVFIGCTKIPNEKLPQWTRPGTWQNGSYIPTK